MTLIETAKTNISSDAGELKPSSDDLFYGGNTEKWIRFANSFKLKLYNQQRLVSNFDQIGFDALIAEDNFFTSMDDDFEFNQTKNIAPTDERNKLFLESYNSTQFSTHMSPWFYEILKGVNPNIHAGNPDPRMNYYFFNQLLPEELPIDQGDPETGNPKADYWDASTGFFSIRFGSIGPWRDFSTESSYTYPGIFPCGGRYNDGVVYKNGSGSRIAMDAQGGTGIAPHRMFTYAEFLYVQAELIHSGKLSGDTAQKLEEALLASFTKVDQVVLKNNSSQNIPNLSDSPEASTFIDAILTEFNSASNSKKLEIIMTQKWVATFGDPGDQYNDYRRTGFPVLADPNSTSKEYQLDNDDDFPLIDTQTVLNNPYQQSLYWPQNELNANKNAPSQKVPSTYKIFWAN